MKKRFVSYKWIQPVTNRTADLPFIFLRSQPLNFETINKSSTLSKVIAGILAGRQHKRSTSSSAHLVITKWISLQLMTSEIDVERDYLGENIQQNLPGKTWLRGTFKENTITSWDVNLYYNTNVFCTKLD